MHVQPAVCVISGDCEGEDCGSCCWGGFCDGDQIYWERAFCGVVEEITEALDRVLVINDTS